MRVFVKRGTGDGEAETAATLTLTSGGDVKIAGDESTAEFLRAFPVVGRDGNAYTFDDGELWLRDLPGNLRGTRVWAEPDES